MPPRPGWDQEDSLLEAAKNDGIDMEPSRHGYIGYDIYIYIYLLDILDMNITDWYLKIDEPRTADVKRKE